MNRRPAKPDGPLQVAYEIGYAAALRGEPHGACRFRAPARVAHWRRGWWRGFHVESAQAARTVLDPAEKQRGQERLDRLREQLRAALAEPG